MTIISITLIDIWKMKTTASTNNGKMSKEKLQTALPQIIAVTIKNVLLLGYGMTLGFPTIVIPRVQGGDSQESLVLNAEQVSWISKYSQIRNKRCQMYL